MLVSWKKQNLATQKVKKEVQWIRLNWALNRFRLAWAYVNWTTEPIQAEQMLNTLDMQLKYTLAWCFYLQVVTHNHLGSCTENYSAVWAGERGILHLHKANCSRGLWVGYAPLPLKMQLRMLPGSCSFFFFSPQVFVLGSRCWGICSVFQVARRQGG